MWESGIVSWLFIAHSLSQPSTSNRTTSPSTVTLTLGTSLVKRQLAQRARAEQDPHMRSPTTARWQPIVLLCGLAVLIFYIDRTNISVAAIRMQEQYHWTETTKGYVLSSFFVGYAAM